MECLKLKDLRGIRMGKCDVAPNTINDEAHSAQKENWFRSSPKTPVKTELAPKRKCCTPDRIQVTPSKLPDKSPPEPWSPTANLRMLISAASPDIRDREEKKKELFRQIENEGVESAGNIIQLAAVDDGTTEEFEQQRPSRKQKSLGLLCQKFLARYPKYPISTEKTEISLDEVATELGVERRRIYDIVNVLESLQLVSRVAKNQYSWHGLQGLGQTLAVLKRRGEQLGYVEQLAHVRHRDLELELDADGEERRDAPQESWPGCQEAASDSPSPEPKSKSVSMNSRKDKSLRIMSEKFVMLFLVAEPRTIALDAAAKILIEEGQPEAVDSSKFKTKIRRLYDIANVLTSLGLIKKVHMNERGRKPVFQWEGPVCQDQPDGLTGHSAALSAMSDATEMATPDTMNGGRRMFSPGATGSPNSAPAEQLKTQSPPCSPQRDRKAARALDAVASSGKMAQLVAACKLQLEEDNKNSESCPRGGVSRPEVAPLVIASLAKLPAPSDQLWASYLPEKGSTVPQAAAPSSGEGCPIFHRGQPFVLLQSLPSTSVLVMYGNVDASTESQPSEQEGGSPLGCREQKAGVCHKRSPAQQHSAPYGPGQDGEPYTKRQKALGSTEGESAGSLASVQSADKEASLWHKAVGSSSECSIVVTGTCAQSPTRGPAFGSVSMGAQEEEKPNRSKMLENGSAELPDVLPQVNDGIQEPPSSHVPKSFLPGGQSGLPENSPCYCLPAASGLSDMNVLLSAVPGRGGFAIPVRHLAPTTLPYQVMLPVLLPTTTSAGGSLLPGLSFLPAAQFLMGGDPVSPPASPAAGSPAQERQDYLATFAPSSRESPPSKTEVSAVQPVAVLKLQNQSPVAMTPSDVHQPCMETYFHTPVPMLQGKHLQGVQVKMASPAQRKLEIESSLAK